MFKHFNYLSTLSTFLLILLTILFEACGDSSGSSKGPAPKSGGGSSVQQAESNLQSSHTSQVPNSQQAKPHLESSNTSQGPSGRQIEPSSQSANTFGGPNSQQTEPNLQSSHSSKENNLQPSIPLITFEMIERAEIGYGNDAGSKLRNFFFNPDDFDFKFLVNQLKGLKRGKQDIDVNEKHKTLKDITLKDKGYTALHYAAALGDSQDIALALLARGADIESVGNGDRTPLHVAVYAGKKEMVGFFIDNRANRDAKDKDNKTPLEMAKTMNKNGRYKEIIDLFNK